MPDEYRLTGTSMYLPTPENSMMLSSFRRISDRRIPSIAPWR